MQCTDGVNLTIQEEVMDLSTVMQFNEETVTTSENEEIQKTHINPMLPMNTLPEEDRESDTPSPIQLCEGQIYSLNKSIQFVREHAKIGDRFIVTSKGLEKTEEPEASPSVQVLTLRGKFSFKFDSE